MRKYRMKKLATEPILLYTSNYHCLIIYPGHLKLSDGFTEYGFCHHDNSIRVATPDGYNNPYEEELYDHIPDESS